jgi:hypothetical protein
MSSWTTDQATDLRRLQTSGLCFSVQDPEPPPANTHVCHLARTLEKNTENVVFWIK